MTRSCLIAAAVLAVPRPDPAGPPDRFSARRLLGLSARLLRDAVGLFGAAAKVAARGAAKAPRTLATFAVDGEIRFASASDRAAFTEELATTIAALIGKYHDENATPRRGHRLVVTIHPSIPAEPVEPAGPDDDEGD
jgi:hypothetical protein